MSLKPGPDIVTIWWSRVQMTSALHTMLFPSLQTTPTGQRVEKTLVRNYLPHRDEINTTWFWQAAHEWVRKHYFMTNNNFLWSYLLWWDDSCSTLFGDICRSSYSGRWRSFSDPRSHKSILRIRQKELCSLFQRSDSPYPSPTLWPALPAGIHLGKIIMSLSFKGISRWNLGQPWNLVQVDWAMLPSGGSTKNWENQW